MGAESIVRVEGLSHRYSRDWAIRDISFEVDSVGVVGLLGSNGAGKSTTMNIMCGVLNQTKGSVRIGGVDMREDPEGAKALLGFLPQNAPLHLELTVAEYLRYCGSIRNIPGPRLTDSLLEVMETCGVAHFAGRLIRNLSGGYRQRVGIAQAIIHKPKVVVLDEPTNGLDPNQIIEVRRLIKRISEKSLVIFSSHVLTEVQAICRDVMMIEQGRIVFADSMHAFNNYVVPDSMRVRMDNAPSVQELLDIDGITQVEALNEGSLRLRFQGGIEISKKVVERSVHLGWGLREIVMEKGSLDEVFAQLSRKK